MPKKSLSKTVFETYQTIDHSLICIKSTIIGLCADIDRYFRFSLNIETNKELNADNLCPLYESFPHLKGLSLEQVNRLIFLFCTIRNVNAHLYLNKHLYLDEDLRLYMERVLKPKYKVVIGKELTMYGMVYVLIFLSQKYMHWDFITHFFRHEYFDEINRKGLLEYHNEILGSFALACGVGAVIFGLSNVNGNKQDFLYINDMNRRFLTTIFFDFEKAFALSDKTKGYSPSFRTLLMEDATLKEDKEVVNLILRIRNCWFHGQQMFDEITDESGTFTFDSDFILDALKRIQSVCSQNEKFSFVVKDIRNYGESFIFFFVQRLVELSYKILDKRLFKKEKMDSRAKKTSTGLERFLAIDKATFEKADSLIYDEQLSWEFSKSNFSDFVGRKTVRRKLLICKLYSESGFDLDKGHINRKELILVEVDIDKGFESKINGRLISEYKVAKEIKYGEHVSIVELE